MIKGTRVVSLGKLTWIDVESPTAGVLSKLKEKYGFHKLDVEDCLSENQRSKIDEYNDYLFIILHVAYYEKRKQRIVSEEVDIFIKNNLVVTVHWGVLKSLTGMFENCSKSLAKRKAVMHQGSGFLLYEIIDALYSDAFPILDKLENGVTNLEKDVFALNQQRDTLKDILILKKNIITFRRVIAPQRTVIAQIEHKNKKFLPEELEIYFDDVVDKVEKIWNNLENLKDLIESLQETNESIISHTTNNVIKILTVFSVVMLPLTFLTSLYGMNVVLPLADHDMAFMLLTGVMIGVVLLMLGFFKFKRWI